MHYKLAFAFLFLAGVFVFSASSPAIKWGPEKIETNIFQGGARTFVVFFESTKDIESVSIRTIPELRPFA